MPVNPFELAGLMLLAAALAAVLLRRQRIGIRIAGAIAGAILEVVPFGPASAATFFLGTFGPVSAATLVMAGGYLFATIAGLDGHRRPSSTMLVCLVAIGAVFYPLTFGLTSFDPYELGYRGAAVPGLMLALVLAGWLTRAADIACWIGLAALLYVLGAYDSNNLWDYLIFPADTIYAAGALAIWVLRTRRSQRPPNLENSSTTRS